MRLPFFALLLFVFATTTGFAAPSMPRPRGAAAPKPSPRVKWPAGHQSVKKTFDVEQRVVSWTYDKLNRPHVVAAALNDVASGKLPRDAVASLASPELVDKLIDAKLPVNEPVRSGPTIGVAPKGQTRKQAKGAGKSEWAKLAGILAVQPEYAPKQLQLPAAYDKEVKRGSVWFTANADGFVTATLPTGAPFRIKNIVAYDGTYTLTPMGPMMNASDSRKTAPFALAVRAGQQFAVTVEFAPEFELGTMMAGVKKGKLRVKDENFTVNVPISAMFNGIHVAGVVLSPTEDVITLDAYPFSKQQVTTKMQVFNLGSDARTATISADELPSGMTLVGSPSVALAGGEVKNVDVTLELDGAPYGYGMPLVLRATAPGGLTSSTNMAVNVVRTFREWEFKQTVSGIDLWLLYRLDASGQWYFFGSEFNDSSPLGWQIDMQLVLEPDYVPNWPFRGTPGTMTGIGGPALVTQHEAWKDHGPDGKHSWSKDFYADLISRPSHFHIEMESVP